MNPLQQTNSAGAKPQVIPPQHSKSNPNSTQNTLQLSEIRDGIVIMNDGSFRAVIMCKAINFDLMSPQEREAVEFSYQGFLNSLYFPIQIFVRYRPTDQHHGQEILCCHQVPRYRPGYPQSFKAKHQFLHRAGRFSEPC